MEHVTFSSQVQEHSTQNGSEKPANTNAPPPPGLSGGALPATRESHRTHNLQVWILLLVVMCLACLGSLSLAPYILPDLIHGIFH
jgi:hypothetical protein